MRLRDGLILGVGLLLAACASRAPEKAGSGVAADARPAGSYKLGKPYRIGGRWYHPSFDPDYDEVGTASWYGADFDGLSTANGEVFDKNAITAAHPTLPLPSLVRVTNLDNGRSIELRVNDRGPFVGDRLIDLSQAAARELGYESAGLARVRVQFLGLADDALGSPPRPAPAPSAAPVMTAGTAAAGQAPGPEAPAPAPVRATAPGVQLASLDETVAPAACEGPARFVQVGAFADSARVHAATARLDDVAPIHVEPVFVGATAAARVRLGPVPAAEATRVLARVQGRGYVDAFLTPTASAARAPACSDT